MHCDGWREAISAQADGEEFGVDERLLDAHLAHCTACRSFREAVDGSRRHTVIHSAEEMPDLSRRVAKTTALLDRASKWSLVRVLLAVVAVQIIVLSLPALVLGRGNNATHDARHLGAFSVAYAVALLVVVVRPARARTVLPVAAVLSGALLVTAIVDMINGAVPFVSEAAHLSELLSVLLMWMLAVPAPRHTASSSGRRARNVPTMGLRIVDSDSREAG